jgi:hypothetical protein
MSDMHDGDLCAFCHQARGNNIDPKLNPAGFVAPDATKMDTMVVSQRFGPHHSTVANVIQGRSGLGYTTAMPATRHLNAPNGCPTCHMPNTNHTMAVTTVGCTANSACHTAATLTTLDYKGDQTKHKAALATIATTFLTKGMADSTGTNGVMANWLLKKNSAGKYGWPQKYLVAWWNFQILVSDRSSGVHNPDYYTALEAYITTLLASK